MLQDYLNQHYITRKELLARLDITPLELDSAIAAGMLPACSYRVQDGSVTTAVFGRHPAPDCSDGEYFTPAATTWYRNSLHLLGDSAKKESTAAQLLMQDFIDSYIKSAQTHPMFRSAFANLLTEPQALEQMATDTWGNHCQGTYGVCVIAPDSVEQIQTKQAAVQRLIDFTDDARKTSYSAAERIELRKLIQSYNTVAMPFSPADYPFSSRKRLVDDLVVP
ncbi:DUF6058 family natural product biosynthesis protein [Microbulbifer sp. SAOS-129_SWC]|uniref:DUF6058 family natural product biosynthesis protein n=1 Tax=Microbulbifer sp. SAOS-129_SWC TaxID=3145235 RepID=UPI0032175090